MYRINKPFIKWVKGILIFIGLMLMAWLLYKGVTLFPRIDFSLDYHKIQGIENIIFERNGWGTCYRRSLGGLVRIEDAQVCNPKNLHESDSSISELANLITTEHYIRQSIYSSNRNYILYCEVNYDYTGSGMTDDEYCYYRAYEIETDTIITIYQGYREWYNLFWLSDSGLNT